MGDFKKKKRRHFFISDKELFRMRATI